MSEKEITILKASGEYDAYQHSEMMRVVRPYLLIGLVIFLWAFLLIRTKFPESSNEKESEVKVKGGGFRQLLKYPHFVQGVIAQFFYVGAQVGTWSYFIQYIQDYTGQPRKSSRRISYRQSRSLWYRKVLIDLPYEVYQTS